MRDWLAGTWAVFEKDVRLELRSRYAVSTLVMFVLGALLLAGLAVVAREQVTACASERYGSWSLPTHARVW